MKRYSISIYHIDNAQLKAVRRQLWRLVSMLPSGMVTALNGLHRWETAHGTSARLSKLAGAVDPITPPAPEQWL